MKIELHEKFKQNMLLVKIFQSTISPLIVICLPTLCAFDNAETPKWRTWYKAVEFLKVLQSRQL